MSCEINICKASPLGGSPIEDVTIEISGHIPDDVPSLDAARNFYADQARMLMNGLSVLPQGTKHALLCLMLESAPSYYRGM